jgi:hypothetical protein
VSLVERLEEGRARVLNLRRGNIRIEILLGLAV